MTFEEAKQYAETTMGWVVADLRDPAINKAGVERIYCYSLQPCGDYTPDEFVQEMERWVGRNEESREAWKRYAETDEDQHPGCNNASTWL